MKTILDHGYLKLIEGWGSDESIIEAARMSTGKGFLGWEPGPCPTCNGQNADTCLSCEGKGTIAGDKKLLNRLWTFKHSSPFEMGGLIIEVQAPIFVFREWHRHRTQSYNEMSARYTPLPNLNYIPSIERLLINSKENKQAGTIKGADILSTESATTYREALQSMYQVQETLYQQALSIGVPKELARVHLPVGRYSRMRASANLRNWFGFLTLRLDAGAQWEIREYAEAVNVLVRQRFPRSWELFHQSHI